MKKLLLFIASLLIAALTTATAQENKLSVSTVQADASKYVGMFELGVLYGENSGFYHNPVASPSLQLFNGYRLHRLLAVGGTLGLDFYENGLLTPLALGLRGNILKTRVSPFYSLDAGYGFCFVSDNDQRKREGGWMINPAIGLKAGGKNNTAFTFSLGYKSQKASSDITEWNMRTERKMHYKRMSVRLGYMF